MMKFNLTKHANLKDRVKKIKESKTEDEIILEDAFMLMGNYLSEIERFQKMNNINKKELAKKIGTSESYLTQVFRGDKPLDFVTISKIRKALGIEFVTKAHLSNAHS